MEQSTYYEKPTRINQMVVNYHSPLILCIKVLGNETHLTSIMDRENMSKSQDYGYGKYPNSIFRVSANVKIELQVLNDCIIDVKT